MLKMKFQKINKKYQRENKLKKKNLYLKIK